MSWSHTNKSIKIAKNFKNVAIITNRDDYQSLIREIEKNKCTYYIQNSCYVWFTRVLSKFHSVYYCIPSY